MKNFPEKIVFNSYYLIFNCIRRNPQINHILIFNLITDNLIKTHLPYLHNLNSNIFFYQSKIENQLMVFFIFKNYHRKTKLLMINLDLFWKINKLFLDFIDQIFKFQNYFSSFNLSRMYYLGIYFQVYINQLHIESHNLNN